MNIELSDRQKATLAAAITVLSGFVIICAVAALLWLLGSFFSRFSNVFLPLAVAAVIALILKPYHQWFVDRMRLPPVLALGAVFLAILVPLGTLLWFFGDRLIVQPIGELVDQFPVWWKSTTASLQERWPRMLELWQQYGLGDRFRSLAEEHGGELLAALRLVGIKALSAGADVFGAVGALLGWAVLPVYVAFLMLIDPRKDMATTFDAILPFLKPETRDDFRYLVNEFVEIIVAFFRGQFVIAFLQGVLYAIGFAAIGLKYGFLLGLILGFLNIIPYLGSILGLGIALPLALFQTGGGWGLVIWVMVVFTAVQTVEAYVLTPRIMGEQTGLHPMAIIVAVFFWGSALNGISGLILAVPLTAFVVVFWRLAREKYIQELL